MSEGAMNPVVRQVLSDESGPGTSVLISSTDESGFHHPVRGEVRMYSNLVFPAKARIQ
jgi:hypothetical protein